MPVVGFFPGGGARLKTASGSVAIARLSTTPVTITVPFFPVACAFRDLRTTGAADQMVGMVVEPDDKTDGSYDLHYASGTAGGYSPPTSIAIDPDAKTVTITPVSSSAVMTWNYWIAGF